MRTQQIFVVGSQARSSEGHAPAASTDPLAAFLPAGNPRYLQGPWSTEGLEQIAPTDRVLVLGAGLAAIDAVLELDDQGHEAPIRLVSSHGVQSRTQRLVAPFVAERLAHLLAAGRLQVFTGSVRGAAAYGDTFVVDVLQRGRKTHSSERYDWIVNCTAADFPQHARTVAPPAQHPWA
jgi:uncharacterized NAD(P)/FAD-binding protein YdhS